MPYEQPDPDEWVQPIKVGYKMACCDCGLVHEMDFRVKNGRVQFRVRRNNRATAGQRIGMGLRKDSDGVWRNIATSKTKRPRAREEVTCLTKL